MYLYITTHKNVNRKKFLDFISRRNDFKVYNIKFINSYISRGYETLVFISDLSENKFLDFKFNLENDVLEVDRCMKYYYIINISYDSNIVNKTINNILKNYGYEFKIIRSHSENGELFMLLKVLNLDPLNKEGIKKLERKINGLNEINRFIKY